MRAGAYGLSLLSHPLNVGAIEALAGGPLDLADLRRTIGTPPQTTLRGHLRELGAAGILVRRQHEGFPGGVSLALTQSGREFRDAAGVLAAWLIASPQGSWALGSRAARSAIKALVEGWSTSMLRALASRPLSLTELDRVIATVNYPALERRLAAMRLAGQVIPIPLNGSRPYRVSRWLREGAGPLLSVAAWERNRLPGPCDAFGRVDAEAIILLTVPLLSLPPDVEGVCRLEVEENPKAAGVLVGIERGRPTICRVEMGCEAPNCAVGTATAWLSALSGGDPEGIEVRGDRLLGEGLIVGMHSALFGRGARKQCLAKSNF